MKKVLVFGSLIAIVFVHYMLTYAIGPEVSTSLALEQFKDPSVQTDTTMRLWNNGNFAIVYVVWALTAVFSYKSEFMSWFENEFVK